MRAESKTYIVYFHKTHGHLTKNPSPDFINVRLILISARQCARSRCKCVIGAFNVTDLTDPLNSRLYWDKFPGGE